MASSRILVIDDEPGIGRLLDTVLSSEGYEVAVLQNTALALELIKQSPFDLIITDIRMPKIDGLQLLEVVRHVTPQVPVMLITAHATVESAIQAMKLGAFDYLVKPFRNDQIKLAVHRVFERDRLLRENALLRKELSTQKPSPAIPLWESYAYRDAKQQVVSAFEKEYLSGLLLKAGGNISQAAAWADMDRKNFYDLLKKHSLFGPSLLVTDPESR